MLGLIRQRCSWGPVTSGAAVALVHDSGVILSNGDGEPLTFETPAAARQFAERFLCEPPAYTPQPMNAEVTAA